MTWIALLLLFERLWKYWLIRRFFAAPTPPITTPDPRTIAILQPILSGDPTLLHCLETNLNRHSLFQRQFLWLVDDNDTIGIAGCKRLIEQYPALNIRLLIYPPPPQGVNPKMFKLIAGIEHTRADLIAVLDDDTMLPNAAWEQCLPYLDPPDVGLAFGLPYYVNFSNFWSALVAVFVNGFGLLTYVPYTFLRSPLTINGMFYVIKRETLEQIGGFSGLETQLCDDYAVAQRIQEHGLRLAQTPLRHAISTQVKDARHYLRILTRWLIFPQVSVMKRAAMRDQVLFYLFAFVPTFAPLLALIGSIAVGGRGLDAFVLLYFSLNGIILWDLNRRYLETATPPWALPLLLLMQLLLPLHTLWALIAPRRINWRGHVMAVQKDGGFSFVARRSDQ